METEARDVEIDNDLIARIVVEAIVVNQTNNPSFKEAIETEADDIWTLGGPIFQKKSRNFLPNP